MSRYINRFTIVPKELFRLNNGPTLSLRDKTGKKTGSYDILTEAGKVNRRPLQTLRLMRVRLEHHDVRCIADELKDLTVPRCALTLLLSNSL